MKLTINSELLHEGFYRWLSAFESDRKLSVNARILFVRDTLGGPFSVWRLSPPISVQDEICHAASAFGQVTR